MSTSVFKRALVSGINHALEKNARIAWSSPEAAEVEILKLADALDGPDVLPEGGLQKESAVLVANELIKAAQARVDAGEKVNAELVAKTASSKDISDVAIESAAAHMRKVAAESMIIAGGEHPNTLTEAARTDSITRLDLHNRPEGAYRVMQGKTVMPEGGAVGEELAHPKAPSSSPALASTVTRKVAAEDMRAGLDSLPAKLKTAALETLAGVASKARTELVIKLAAAGRTVRIAKLAEDPAALMAALEGGHDGGGEAPMPEAGGEGPQSHLSPEVVQLIMSLLQGHTALEGAPGAPPVGAPVPEMAPPGAPGEHSEPDGDEGGPPEKGASDRTAVLAFLDKVADGGSLNKSDSNTLTSAAKTDNVAKLDVKNRAEGAYEVSQGKTKMPNAGHVGAKRDTPETNTDHCDTAPTREMPKSAEELASDAEYAERFAKVAKEYLPKLPAAMPRAEKVAALKILTGPTPRERAEAVSALSR